MEFKSQGKISDMELLEIKEYIFNEIKKRGWKQADLAKKSGVTPSKLTNLKKGHDISGKNLYLILKTFGFFKNITKTEEKYTKLCDKYFKIEEENNRLKTKIASYEKILTFCKPPEGVEERRLCRVQYDKSFKELDLQPL